MEAQKETIVATMDLSEKDLYCIARHIQGFVEDCKNAAVADFGRPCEECKYNDCCDFDVWPTFGRLSVLTNVEISPLISVRS